MGLTWCLWKNRLVCGGWGLWIMLCRGPKPFWDRTIMSWRGSHGSNTALHWSPCPQQTGIKSHGTLEARLLGRVTLELGGAPAQFTRPKRIPYSTYVGNLRYTLENSETVYVRQSTCVSEFHSLVVSPHFCWCPDQSSHWFYLPLKTPL